MLSEMVEFIAALGLDDPVLLSGVVSALAPEEEGGGWVAEEFRGDPKESGDPEGSSE